MAFYYGGILEGIMAADARKTAADDRRINQERYDAGQKREDERWALTLKEHESRIASGAENNFLTFLKSYKPQSSSRGSGALGSVASNVELTNALEAVQGMLPENSPTTVKLVNAPLKSLQEAIGIIKAAKAKAQENGQVWSSELSESLFEDMYITTVENKLPFDPEVLAEQAGIDYEGNTTFGIPWKEIISQYLPSPTSTAVTFNEKTSVKPLDPSQQRQLQSLYRGSLEGPLADMKADFNARLARGETVDQEAVKKVDEALANLTGDNPSTRLAVQLVGPQAAIDLLTMNPNAQQYRTYINKGLVFSEDSVGEELLSQAIRVGLLVEGDKIMLGSRLVPITAATVAAAQEN